MMRPVSLFGGQVCPCIDTDRCILESGLIHKAKPEKPEFLFVDAKPVGHYRNGFLTFIGSVIAKTPDFEAGFVGTPKA